MEIAAIDGPLENNFFLIEYYDRHGMKQCLKLKQILFGFKVWYLCTTDQANFELYERFGKCITPLIDMIDGFDDDVRALPLSFHFDNLFTGIPALPHVKSLGYNEAGTIRENRLPQGCSLKDKKKVSIERGRVYIWQRKSFKRMDIHFTVPTHFADSTRFLSR